MTTVSPFCRLVPTFLAGCAVAAAAAPAAPRLELRAAAERVGMGRTLQVEAQLQPLPGNAAQGWLLLPYLDGKRWGHHEYSDAEGRAVFRIPLPVPGQYSLRVEAVPPRPPAVESWIWAPETRDRQTVFLQHGFEVPAGVSGAALWLAVDDQAEVWLDGNAVAQVGGWSAVKPVALLAETLRQGSHVLSIRAENGLGPAAVLVRLEVQTPAGGQVVASGPDWRVFETAPPAWPALAPGAGGPARRLGSIDEGPWSGSLGPWPTRQDRARLFTGAELPADATVSEALRVQVEPRPLDRIPADPEHLIGVQWEPWFTPQACWWQTAYAVPLMGFYHSNDPRVTRQHVIWLVEAGVDFLIADWTNHLWDKQHWADRDPGADSIVQATTRALETLADMRDEGIAVPKMVLYPGLNNGPSTTLGAINEELEWIHREYLQNPRFHDLFLWYQGKPLVLIHNGAGPDWIQAHPGPTLDERFFTVRWHGSQHQINRLHERGYWSWMDGSLEPMLTLRDGRPECLTVSVGFFADGGWLAPSAYGRRGGWTLVESFKAALKHRPTVIQLHQFNEFAGQPEGQGYGPKHDVYLDSYSVEFSDDLEPVSLTAPAYRGAGGWGFLYLNLTRALVDLYRQPKPRTTVLALARPGFMERLTGDSTEVVWTWAGRPPESFTLLLDGRPVLTGVQGPTARLDLRGLPPGRHTVRLLAPGAVSRYRLSWTDDAPRLTDLEPASAETPFVIER